MRRNPHHNKSDLQLVQKTQDLFYLNEPFFTDPLECMREARRQARRILKGINNRNRKIKRAQQSIARRINFGLARPGLRPQVPELRTISVATRNKRQNKTKEKTDERL